MKTRQLLILVILGLGPFLRGQERENTAAKQLKKAIDLEFSLQKNDDRRGHYSKAIEAYKDVSRFYPAANRENIVALGNIARIWLHELKEPEKAKKIYHSLLKRSDLSKVELKLYSKEYMNCVIENCKVKDLEASLAKACRNFPVCEVAFKIQFSIRLMSMALLDEEANLPWGLVSSTLSDLVLNQDDLSPEQGAVVYGLLSKISILQVGRQAMLAHKRGKPAKGNMLPVFVLPNVRLSESSSKNMTFNYLQLMQTAPKTGLSLLREQRIQLVENTSEYIEKQRKIRDLKLRAQGIKVTLELARTVSSKSLVNVLRRYKEAFAGQTDRLAIQATVDLLERLPDE